MNEKMAEIPGNGYQTLPKESLFFLKPKPKFLFIGNNNGDEKEEKEEKEEKKEEEGGAGTGKKIIKNEKK